MALGIIRPVLVVEDELDRGEILELVLESAGYRTRRARSVREAVSVLEDCSVRYVITDATLRGDDGLALLRTMQEHRAWRAIPATVVSRDDPMSATAIAARGLGASFMTKPLDLKKVVSTVRRELDVTVECAPRTAHRRARAFR